MVRKEETVRSVWVEKMCLLTFILLMSRRLFCPFSLRYDRQRCPDRVTRLILIMQKLIPVLDIAAVDLTLAQKNAAGCALRYDASYNLNCCLTEFCRKNMPDEENWYSQMVKSYLATCLQDRVYFITMLEAEIDRVENRGLQELVLDYHPVNGVIIGFYKQKGFVVCQSLSLMSYLRLGRSFIYLFLNLLHRLYPKPVKTNIRKRQPAVWIQYHIGELSGFPSFSFWRQNISQIGYDLVYYLDRPDVLVNDAKDVIVNYEGQGYRWIDCHDIWRFVRLGLDDAKAIIQCLLVVNLRHPLWLYCFKFEVILLFRLYLKLFVDYQVKVLVQHQEASWRQAIQAQALTAAGGIMMGFSWSNFIWTTIPSHLYPQHVFFVWGMMQREYLMKRGNTCQYILPAGLWFGKSKKKSERLAAMIKSCSLTIAIFDSSVHYRSHHSPDSLAFFLNRIIAILEKNTDWGGIVKSKKFCLNEYRTLPGGAQIVTGLERLVEQNRLVILDHQESPVTAAVCADIAVCYALNSAGIVAGLHGIPAIHWDCSGWLKYPIYQDADQKSLYLTLDELEDALIEFSQGSRKIGDLGRWRRVLNYFGDSDGGVRVGGFVDYFMHEVIQSGDAKQALEIANSEYIAQHSIGNDFFKKTDMYGSEVVV